VSTATATDCDDAINTIAALDRSTRRDNRERLLAGIPGDWRAALRDAIEDESFGSLADYLAEQRSLADTEIYPRECRPSGLLN
jgi:hypothetical protein